MSRYTPSGPLFSPDGRIYEVEYAMEELSKAVPAVAILAEDGIVAAAAQEEKFALMSVENSMYNIYRVDNDNACILTGVMTDAFKFVSALQSYSQRHRKTYGELMSMERLVDHICSKKQSYTMYSGKRPFGISVIYMGWDMQHSWQLYQSDPSGNYTAWKCACIGRNAHRAQRYLHQMLTIRPQPDLNCALGLAIRAIKVAKDNTTVSGANVRMTTMQRRNNKTEYQVLEEGAVQELCRIYCNSPQASVSSYFDD